jgi:hypothetical protein
MSPTRPTFTALNDRLNKAHNRIRELEARETELLARVGTLGAAIAVQRWESDGGAVLDLRNRGRIDV